MTTTLTHVAASRPADRRGVVYGPGGQARGQMSLFFNRSGVMRCVNANDGAIISSSDSGVTWTQDGGYPAFLGQSGFSAAEGPSGYLIPLPSGRVAFSTTLNHWMTVQVFPFTGATAGACAYGNGVFVVVSSLGCAYSSNGIDWTLSSLVTTTPWTAVVFGNGQFVAVATSGTKSVMTSPDGITWTLRTQSQSNQWNAVAWNGTVYAAVAASGTNRVMTSPDGITWTNRSAAAALVWRTLGVRGSLFVAAAAQSSGTGCMTSPDGITWTTRTLTTSVNTRGFFYDGTTCYIGGSSMNTSPDGLAWTARTIPGFFGSSKAQAAFGAGVYSFIGGGAPQCEYSADLATWTTGTIAGGTWTSLIFASGQFVAVGASVAATSPDGITYTSQVIAAVNWNQVIFAGGQFVAVGANAVATSPDGVTWTSRTPAENANWIGITHNGALYVACAADGAAGIMTSPDAITWTLRTPSVVRARRSIAYGAGLFVILAQDSTPNVLQAATSSDGITWTERATPAQCRWEKVIFADGIFVAVSSSATDSPQKNAAMWSSDAITWRACHTSWATHSFCGVLFNASKWLLFEQHSFYRYGVLQSQ